MSKLIICIFGLLLLGFNVQAESIIVSRNEYTQNNYEVAKNFSVKLKYHPDFERIVPGIKINIANFYEQFQELFGDSKKIQISLSMLPPTDFRKLTGAPEWTNALFYNGQIFLPIELGSNDIKEYIRPLRHELSHALIKSLTAGKCPGWLDEGIAQWAEGEEIDGLRGALAYWYEENDKLLDYKLLQGGFTGLSNSQVAPAYAQSLMASKMLFKTYGLEQIKVYFGLLRMGKRDSFKLAFGTSEDQFWKLLQELLKKEKIIEEKS